jgi:hypothetical protein
MNLIDWGGVAKNALWILGLAVILAGLSYADWWAGVNHQRLTTTLRSPLFQIPFNLGMMLFAAGLASTSRSWWEIGAWSVLLLLFAWQTIVSWQARRQTSHISPSAPPAPTPRSDPPGDPPHN